ncbi:MAG TPA: octaprenyl diphosphate synthase [Holosporales bacterium]|nr:octaprenyl diphosphate synthase [Holosporales bacterium]
MQSVLQLHKCLSDELREVDSTLKASLETHVPIIKTLGTHILNAGGKRLRPLLTLASAKLFTPNLPIEAIYLASAVELIHTATLIHDDVLDESELRRGVKTANNLWGNSCSVLVGDFLFARSFELMVKCKDFNILTTLSQTSGLICQGEVKQLTLLHNTETLTADYLDVIKLKTASLFKAACFAGAKIAGATTEAANTIGAFGENLGIAFQIIDDILDYAQNADKMGKQPGDDYQEGKMSLPIIELFKVKPDLKPIFIDKSKEHFDVIKQAMLNHDIFHLCYKQAQLFTTQAIESLKNLPENDIKNKLNSVAHEVLDRSA